MTELCYHRNNCRLCGSDHLTRVLELTPTPPANAFVSEADKDTAQTCFPLDVYFCQACAHLQLLDVVNPSVLFENYVYVSGTSPVFVQHFEDYAENLIGRFDHLEKGRVLDIGSNDGTLLKAFKKRGMTVLGIDPAKDIAKQATDDGIPTIADFFNKDRAAEILKQHGPMQCITANNVFAHGDDLQGIVNGVKVLLDDQGVFVFEVSYALDVYEKTLFDTIYHEHLAYHSLKPLQRFFERNGLRFISAKRVASHGGSLRGIVARKNSDHARDNSAPDLIALEHKTGIDKAETWAAFGAKINQIKSQLMEILEKAKDHDKTIAAFGAPAKATTLMYHFGLGPDTIDFIIDDSPLKQGLYSPGMHIPVLSSRAIDDKKPDMIVILAWNFAETIIGNHQDFLNAGGQFVVPLPTVEIV